MQAKKWMGRDLAGVLVFLAMGVFAMGAAARQPVYGALYGGGTSFNTDYTFALPVSLDLEDDADSFGLGVGYEINANWFLQLDYTHSDADDVDIDQVFLSLNYQRPLVIDGMQGFVGLVWGEGTLDWNSPPDFADARFDDLDDDEALYGIRFGLSYDLSEHWSTNLTYLYFDQEFNTNIDVLVGIDPDGGEITSRAEFEHRDHQYVLFGIRYHL